MQRPTAVLFALFSHFIGHSFVRRQLPGRFYDLGLDLEVHLQRRQVLRALQGHTQGQLSIKLAYRLAAAQVLQ